MQAKLLTLCMALCAVCLSATSQNVPDYVPTEGLVGWYPFNGNANDESGNGNDGVANGAVLSTDRWGLTNRSYSFSGSGDYIVAPRLYQNAFSVSLWFKTESVQGYNPLIDAFDSNWEIQLKNSHPDYVSFNDEGGYIEHLASNTVQNNVWYNLVCTLSDGTASFYIDGTLTDQFSVFALPDNSGDYFIGASMSGIPQFFIGRIDDIGIWNHALTDEEVLGLYNTELPVSGCTDPAACNFNAEANMEDDSCLYPLFGTDCETGAAACGEGTEWDVTVQACVVSDFCQEDLDGDGVIGVNDLMQLLSVFGTDCPIWMCGDPVNYDGYDYATVQIGEQCWFAETLRTELYQNGDSIPGNLNSDEWTNTTQGAQAILQEDPNNLDVHGRLYNYYAVLDVRGMCPTGWHIPSDEEWLSLAEAVGGVEVAGVSMKNSSNDLPAWDGTNSSGWNGTPGGKREMAGWYGTSVGYWWTSTTYGCGGWHRNLHPNNDALTLSSYCNTVGFSVRCLKDTE